MKLFYFAIQFIRCIYAAFARVCGALRPSFLNLKGGGGAETRRAVARVFSGVCAVVFASLFATQNAFAWGAHVSAANGFIYGVAEYDTEADAEAALMQVCSDNSTTCPASSITTFENMVVIRTDGDSTTTGTGTNYALALLDALTSGDSLVDITNDYLGVDGILCADGDGDLQAQAATENCTRQSACIGDQTDDIPNDACIDPTCVGDQTVVAGVCTDPTCVGDQTLIDGVCVNPTCVGDQTVIAGFCTDPTCGTGTTGVATNGLCACAQNFENPDRISDTQTCDPIPETPTCGDNAFLNSDNMCECNSGFNDEDGDGDCTRTEDETVNSSEPVNATARAESDVRDNAIIGVGGAAAVGVAAWLLSSGRLDTLLFFSPDVGYSLTESGYSVRAGGRVDFRKDRWHLYWTAGQESVNGDFGDFRYSSGGSYAADFWAASFSEKVSGEIVDYDVSLSANYGEGVWQISPVYRLHSRFEEEEDGGLESETTNSLNLEGILRANRWILRPSAGFQWREMDDFADNAKFGISAVRNL